MANRHESFASLHLGGETARVSRFGFADWQGEDADVSIGRAPRTRDFKFQARRLFHDTGDVRSCQRGIRRAVQAVKGDVGQARFRQRRTPD